MESVKAENVMNLDLLINNGELNLKYLEEYIQKSFDYDTYDFIKYLYGLNGYFLDIRYESNNDYAIVRDSNLKGCLILKYTNAKITNEVAKENLLFFESLGNKYNINQFKLISINGYSETYNEYSLYNLILEDISFFSNLIETYLNNDTYIDLYAHNFVTSKLINENIKTNRYDRFSVIQATGTGKSVLIYKAICDNFKNKKVLFLSPSNNILNQFKNNFEFNNVDITYMTYSKLLFNKVDTMKDDFDLIILDEFHRCGAKKWNVVINQILSKSSYVLGVSATPTRYLDNNRDMSKELFNHKINELSLLDAMIQNVVNIPKYIIALYTLDNEKAIIENKIDENDRIDATNKNKFRVDLENINVNWNNTTGIPILLKKHIKPYMNKFIVFCTDKKQLQLMRKRFTEWFQSAGYKNIKEYIVYASLSNNSKKIKDFEQESIGINLLFCIDMLNEGIHVDVNGVFLFRRTISPIIFYQQIGRAIQTGSTKTPIIFDLVDNVNSLDLKFSDNLNDTISNYNRKRNSLGLPKREFKLDIIDETKDVVRLFSELNDKLEDNWGFMYTKLLQYNELNGDCNVPVKKTTLGNWCSKQRYLYQKNMLSKNKIKQLEEIGFIWDIYDNMWFSRYNEYKNNEIKTEGLMQWISTQRLLYKDNELSDDKIKLLESIDFNWNMKSKTKLDWDTMFESFIDYVNKFATTNIKVNYIDENGYKLGSWIRNQKYKYSKNKVFSGIEIIRRQKLIEFGIL